MDLNVNHRSGSDIWYSGLLTSCRQGDMSLTDWQFLHGLPTNECGSWLVRQELSLCGNPECRRFKEKTKELRLETPERWFEEARKFECEKCVVERQRRHRVMPALEGDAVEDNAATNEDPNAVQDTHGAVPAHLRAALSSSRFNGCLFVTRCNEPVGAYALQRACLFARATSSQLLWIQAEDYLDDPHFADLSMNEKMQRKTPWLYPHLHARKTGGIPSLLPLCYDLPLRCRFGNYGG